MQKLFRLKLSWQVDTISWIYLSIFIFFAKLFIEIYDELQQMIDEILSKNKLLS